VRKNTIPTIGSFDEVQRAVQAAMNCREFTIYRFTCTLDGWRLVQIPGQPSARDLRAAVNRSKLYIYPSVSMILWE
jgi:hypothetical protein